MTFIPSIHQIRLAEWTRNGRGSAVVEAVAGSGKSTSIERMVLPEIPESKTVIGLAFNASVAKEWKEIRLPRLESEYRGQRNFNRVQFRTFHSLGLGAICKRLGCSPREMKTDDNKSRTLLRASLGELEYEVYGAFCVKLTGLAKGQGVGALTPDTEERWYEIVDHHDLYLDSDDADLGRAVEISRELLRRSTEVALRDRLIDYDDMIYLPIIWGCRLFGNDWVIVDELQDVNPARIALAKMALKPGGRFLGVGDPHQAIYGFTGAMHDAMDRVKHQFNCAELYLSVCYRCGTSIVERARKYVDHIEPAPEAPLGAVSTMDLDAALKVLGSHDAVLCRQTAPLLGLAYQLIARGVGCTILGRDIAAGLVALIKKQRARGIDNLVAKLEAYRDREVAKHMAKGEEGKAEAVNDRVSCIFTVIDHLDELSRTVPALITRLEGMFSDTNGVLILSTVHKAKGKEWDHVAILSPELMPSRWARQDWQQIQENNLIYVAITRARKNLIYLEGVGA